MSGLYRGVSGLGLGTGLSVGSAGLWDGASGLQAGGGLTIASLFRAGDSGVWYDPSDNTKLRQLSGGTGTVALNDPVGYIAPSAGTGSNATQATAGFRPLWKQDGNGKYYLYYDGTDDYHNITCFSADASTLCVAAKIRAAGAAFKVIFQTVKQTIMGDTTTNKWGTYNTVPIPTSYDDNSVKVLTLRSRASNDVDCYTNTTKETFTSGGAYNVRSEYLGTANGAVQFADMDLYGVFAINRVLSDSEVSFLIAQMRAKAGI